MRGVDGLGLLEVEAGRVGVDAGDVEGRDHLLEGEHVAVLRDRPTEQGQVVQQSLGQEAVVAVGEEVRLGIALGELLVALPHHVGQVPEARCRAGDAHLDERVVEGHLARGAGEEVLAAQHVRDLHQGVVDGVDQRVERVAVGPGEREVGHVVAVEGDRPADEVVERDLTVGHPEPDDRLATLGPEGGDLLVAQLAAVPVVAHHLGARGLAPRLDLVVAAVAVVGARGRREPLERVGVDRGALALAVRRERAADVGPLVPVEPEPAHHLEQAVVGLLGVAGGVGVLDAEDEGAAGCRAKAQL